MAPRRLRPPVLGRALLRMRRLGDRRGEIEAYLDELFRERAGERGRGYAAFRYCADAFSLWVHNPASVVPATVLRPGSGSRRGGYGGASIDPGRHDLLDTLLFDVKFALRNMRRRPGFAAAAVLTVALGIGANAAMFGVIKAVVLGPLPFAAPDRVVQMWDMRPVDERGTAPQISKASFRDYERLNDVFSRVAAIGPATVYREHESRFEYVPAFHVSADMFDIMGVEPTRGRTFRPEEDSDGVETIVLLTHAFWLRELGGEEVIGRTLSLRRPIYSEDESMVVSELEYRIIGVLPPDFRLPPFRRGARYRPYLEPDLLLPLGLDTRGGLKRDYYSLRVLAELPDGVSVEQARSNLQAIATGIAESAPDTEKGLEAMVVPVGELLRQACEPTPRRASWSRPLVVLLGEKDFSGKPRIDQWPSLSQGRVGRGNCGKRYAFTTSSHRTTTTASYTTCRDSTWERGRPGLVLSAEERRNSRRLVP